RRLGMRHDTDDDFDAPWYPEGHPYRRFVLYRTTANDWQARRTRSGSGLQVAGSSSSCGSPATPTGATNEQGVGRATAPARKRGGRGGDSGEVAFRLRRGKLGEVHDVANRAGVALT